MKKLLLFSMLTFVLVCGVGAAVEKKACKLDNSGNVTCAKSQAAKGCPVQECKKLISKLKEIRETAVNENATETVKALDTLIANGQKCQLSKGKDCPADCVKKCCATGCAVKCCAAKKKSGTCPKVKDAKGCAAGCTKPCCVAKKKSGTCPKTEAKKSCCGK